MLLHLFRSQTLATPLTFLYFYTPPKSCHHHNRGSRYVGQLNRLNTSNRPSISHTHPIELVSLKAYTRYKAFSLYFYLTICFSLALSEPPSFPTPTNNIIMHNALSPPSTKTSKHCDQPLNTSLITSEGLPLFAPTLSRSLCLFLHSTT